jgi:Protein of unknown function (DUF1656)
MNNYSHGDVLSARTLRVSGDAMSLPLISPEVSAIHWLRRLCSDNGSARGEPGFDLGRISDRRQPAWPRSTSVDRVMMHSFPELTIGGVLVAPFVIYVGASIAIFAVLRPFLHLVAFDRAFSNPPVAELSLYVLILALLIVLF